MTRKVPKASKASAAAPPGQSLKISFSLGGQKRPAEEEPEEEPIDDDAGSEAGSSDEENSDDEAHTTVNESGEPTGSPAPSGKQAKKAVAASTTTTPAKTPAPKKKKKAELNPRKHLTEKLLWLHKILKGKDEYGFFLEPVDTDQVPDYLTVIKTPMDFQTIENRIKSNHYTSMEQFQDDIELICQNCKTFNPPDTLYWRSADRLESFAVRVVAKEAERFRAKFGEGNVAAMPVATAAPATPSAAPRSSAGSSSTHAPSSSREQVGSGDEHDSDEEIDILSGRGEVEDDSPSSSRANSPTPAAGSGTPGSTAKKYRPSTYLSTSMRKRALYRRAQDGTFVFSSTKRACFDADGSLLPNFGVKEMSIVPTQPLPDSNAPPLSTLTPTADGNNTHMAPTRPEVKVAPIAYTAYGPFSSFAPSTDAARAILSPEDSLLLALTYGDVLGAAYAKSLEDFAAGSGIPDVAYKLLDTLSGGTHSALRRRQSGVTAPSLPVVSEGLELSVTPERDEGDVVKAFERVKQLKASGAFERLGDIDVRQLRIELEGAGIDADVLLPSTPMVGGDQMVDYNAIQNKDPAQLFLDQNAALIAETQMLQRQRFLYNRTDIALPRERELGNLLRDRLVRAAVELPPSMAVPKQVVDVMLPRILPNEPLFVGTLMAPQDIRPTQQQQQQQQQARPASYTQYPTAYRLPTTSQPITTPHRY